MVKFHEDYLKGWDGDLKSLARAICDLKYDRAAEFIEELAKAVEEDYVADLTRERFKLSQALEHTSKSLYNASNEMKKAWKICEPFMKPSIHNRYSGTAPKRLDLADFTDDKGVHCPRCSSLINPGFPSLYGQCKRRGLKWYSHISGFTVAGAECRDVKAEHEKINKDARAQEKGRLCAAEREWLLTHPDCIPGNLK